MSALKRRSFIASVATIPLSTFLPETSDAVDLPQLEECDPLTRALEYVHRSENNEKLCKGCHLFQGQPSTEWGYCGIFPGKGVNANGWCKSWIVKIP